MSEEFSDVRALFVPAGAGRYLATDLALGPWSRDLLHGGAVAALLAHVLEEDVPATMAVAEVCARFLRPLSRQQLRIDVVDVRRGRRVLVRRANLVSAGALIAEATCVAAARRPSAADSDGAPANRAPVEAISLRLEARSFLGDGMQVLYYEAPDGSTRGWFRLRVPVVAGRQVGLLQRMAAAGDLAGTMSMRRGAVIERAAINTDVRVTVLGQSDDEWIGMDAAAHWGGPAGGHVIGRVTDRCGDLGRVSSLLVEQEMVDFDGWSPRRWTRVPGFVPRG